MFIYDRSVGELTDIVLDHRSPTVCNIRSHLILTKLNVNLSNLLSCALFIQQIF